MRGAWALAVFALAGSAAALGVPGPLKLLEHTALDVQAAFDAHGGDRFPTLPVAPASGVSPQLAAFFDSFDANHDGALQVREARAFFAWVRDHVPYRYDDENAPNPRPGYAVGDGRPGPDYQQTPAETFDERAGDCEDTAGLEAAFYRHFGVPAFVAAVQAKSSLEADHAVVIVRAAASPEEFALRFGGLAHYTIAGSEGLAVPLGVYLVLDHAGSDSFGGLAAGPLPGGYRAVSLLPL